MKLYEGKIGRIHIVESVLVEQKMTRRLEAPGVNEQTPITIMNKKGSDILIIKVRGARLALGRRVAEGIDTREARPDEWKRAESGGFTADCRRLCGQPKLWEDHAV